MENPISSAFRTFWHAITSNDRHASHNSPYRTGQHVPISQSRHAPLTSVATSASESHPDLTTPYHDDFSKRPSISSVQLGRDSPSRPYSPGMRSASSTKIPSVEEASVPGEIQMQSFVDGGPPPPPPSHSWMKIDKWVEAQYTELYDQLGEGCTQNDINELEHELDLTLPQDVRESLSIHDGQERGGRPTGIIFGCMLLDCEEIVQEWRNWKVVNEEYLSGQKRSQQAVYPLRGLNNGASSSTSHPQQNRYWRQDLLDRQDSQPPKAVQKAYAHPAWIALARDWGGNNIAVDLAPGPNGKWGQVIMFGRDYDTKYVVARSWSHFLATVADDLNSGKTYVDEETGELKLKEFKTETVEPSYMDILRWRADQKYGRRPPRRQSRNPPGLNTNVSGVNGKASPYGSPSTEDRGRSPQRFSRGQAGSPRHGMGGPLARVQEEIVQPQPVRPGGDVVKDFAMIVQEEAAPTAQRPKESLAPITTAGTVRGKDKLIDVPTPISARGDKKELPSTGIVQTPTQNDEDKENESQTSAENPKGLGVNGVETEMKNIAI